MFKYLFILLLLSYSCSPRTVEMIDFNFHEYKLNEEIKSQLDRTGDYSEALNNYSFVLETKKISQILSSNPDTISAISEADWLEIQKTYQFKNAVEVIVHEAEKYNFCFLNESHFISQHRNFVRQLLPHLAKIGYRYLALEGLNMQIDENHYEHSKNNLGFPTYRSGFYMSEPEYGNLIREATKLGFEVFGYDQFEGEREELGANNILKKVGMDGVNGKTLVLCGYDHIKESEIKYWGGYALAGRVKNITKNDVLTINQTLYAEREFRNKENSVYQKFNSQESMVLVDQKNVSFDAEKNSDWYDLFVFHPRTTYEDGFPNWYLKTNPIKSFKLPKLTMDYPWKIFVYDENDDITIAVPIFIMETDSLTSKIDIPIPKNGKSKLVISNKNVSYLIE